MAPKQLGRVLLFGLLGGSLLALANAQANITASTCADPSAFTSCNANVQNRGNDCINRCNGDDSCIVDCQCETHQDYFNCAASACWNQVYSCQYQNLVRQYFSICPNAVNPPFWPAPANASGACSCNYGQVWDYIRRVGDEQIACYNDAIRSANGGANTDDMIRQESGCACCGASGIYSAIHNLCPNVSPALLFPFPNGWPFPFPSSDNFPIPSNLPIPSPPVSLPGGIPLPLPSPLPAGLPIPSDIPAWAWSSCQETLNTVNCPNLGFAEPPGGRFFAPDGLPQGTGTVTVSDGSGTIRVPPSGTVFSWDGSGGSTYTVSAQGVRVTETNGAFGTGTETETGTGALPTVTDSSGVVSGRIGEKVVTVVVVGLGVALFVL